LRGVYTLIIRFPHRCKATVGTGFSLIIDPGLYLYTGSALGHGSTSLESRIGRHLRRDKHAFWHIDRLLACPSAEVVSVVFAETTRNAECRVNAAVLRDSKVKVPFRGIGSSDCRCASHFLLAERSFRSLLRRVGSCYSSLRLSPHVLNRRSSRSGSLVIPKHGLRKEPNAKPTRTRQPMPHQQRLGRYVSMSFPRIRVA